MLSPLPNTTTSLPRTPVAPVTGETPHTQGPWLSKLAGEAPWVRRQPEFEFSVIHIGYNLPLTPRGIN